MINILILQHVPFEPPAAIETWARNRGLQMSILHLYENRLVDGNSDDVENRRVQNCVGNNDGDARRRVQNIEPLRFPGQSDFDWLIVMGGPMGVHDDAVYPFLADEKTVIRQSIDSHKTIIGICLGAQLIAHVLGARVYPNPNKEIGIFPISITPEAAAADTIFRDMPKKFPVVHWHGDTFDLPEGAIRIASSEACINQGFMVGKNIFALQFHMEATRESLAALLDNGEDELSAGGQHVMTRAEIEFVDPHDLAEMNGKLENLLDTLMGRWLIASNS